MSVTDPPTAAFSYVLPLASATPIEDVEFGTYLAWLAEQCEVIVVDGSPPDVFGDHSHRWPHVLHLAPGARTLMGKVGNVLTGIRAATHDRVVIADDDIRYGPELHELVARLDDAEVVRPQNYFGALPWHAVWDSGRSLLNRMLGGDWPGTLAVRRSTLVEAGGYAGTVMFENYELCKTVEAAGGRHRRADDIFVRRLPPTTRHFLSQRVRQAYDELARPARLVAFLAPVPALIGLGAARNWRALVIGVSAVAASLVGVAEVGRHRGGAHVYFPFRCSMAAPVWFAERSVCAWLAVVQWALGGIPYRGRRIRRAALRPRERRMALATAS